MGAWVNWAISISFTRFMTVKDVRDCEIHIPSWLQSLCLDKSEKTKHGKPQGEQPYEGRLDYLYCSFDQDTGALVSSAERMFSRRWRCISCVLKIGETRTKSGSHVMHWTLWPWWRWQPNGTRMSYPLLMCSRRPMAGQPCVVSVRRFIAP